ncbi:hypothetical protein F5X98DRAFT_341805 [Xylaria grammica]|nr:hypothetical protein F5X98DRAFT_341805 [Xylaria grammica]
MDGLCSACLLCSNCHHYVRREVTDRVSFGSATVSSSAIRNAASTSRSYSLDPFKLNVIKLKFSRGRMLAKCDHLPHGGTEGLVP